MKKALLASALIAASTATFAQSDDRAGWYTSIAATQGEVTYDADGWWITPLTQNQAECS